MKLDTFFEKFELFADAPDAVAKMRELVLEMASQGKLSEQRGEDTEDPGWLELIHKLDADAESAIAGTKPPFEIPSAWRWATLESLGDTKPRNDAPDCATTSFVPMTLIPAEFGQSAKHELRPWGEIKKGYTHFQDGDVVMAKITPCFENGKSAIMSGLTGGIGAGTTELHVFRRNGAAILPEFVIIHLKSRGFIMRGIPRMTGSAGQKRVPSDYFARAPFPLPPLAEQKRIVAKVDELMALCDRLDAQQQEREKRHAALARASLARFVDAPTPANLDFLFHKSYAIPPADLRKSILTLAVQGKLVPQDPNDEPADRVWKKIEKERQIYAEENRIRAFVESEVETEPFQLPMNWKWVRLASLFKIVTDGDHLPPPKSESGVAFLTIGNITTGKLEFDGCRFVPSSYFDLLASYRRPSLGDILYTVVGATYGRPALVGTDRPFCVQRHIAILKPSANMDVSFLFYLLKSPLAYDQASTSTTGTAQPTIPLSALRNFVVPLPPLAEQCRIVSKVDELMALVDQLEEQLSIAKNKSADLLETALHELLNPSAEIIPFPSETVAPLPDRAAIGCYAIRRLADTRTFGRTAQAKVLYLVEAHLGLELGGRYTREAAGPLDRWVYTFEEQAAEQQWFSVVESPTKDGQMKIDYRKGPKLSAKAGEAATQLPPELRKEFDRLLALLANKRTVEVEIIATLFADWNDALIDGHAPSDAEIIRDVRENWHPSKQRFDEPELQKWLSWMRRQALVPKGQGPHTRGSQAALRMH